MNKTMVLYTENYRTSIYEEKKHGTYQKLRNFDLEWKKIWLYTKIIEIFEQIYSFRTMIYYG